MKNGAGEGRHVYAGINRVHPDKPIGGGFFDIVRALIYFIGI